MVGFDYTGSETVKYGDYDDVANPEPTVEVDGEPYIYPSLAKPTLCNAKDELLREIGHLFVVEAADIYFRPGGVELWRRCVLPVNHTSEERERFLESLDFVYDPLRLGSAELHGVVWLTDDSWLERGQRDGWLHRRAPEKRRSLVERV